ncbi:hypothetical protein Tco_0112614, partial [Tanacetum coccineum]
KQQRIDITADALYNEKQENLRVWLPRSSRTKWRLLKITLQAPFLKVQKTFDRSRSSLGLHGNDVCSQQFRPQTSMSNDVCSQQFSLDPQCRMTSVHNSSGLKPQCQMTSVHNSPGLDPQCRMTSVHNSSGLKPQCQMTSVHNSSGLDTSMSNDV